MNPVSDDQPPALPGAIVERSLVPRLPGVFCLEGEWSPEDRRRRWSVEPILQLMERLEYLTAIHRDVASKAELTYYLGKWVQVSELQQMPDGPTELLFEVAVPHG